MIIEPNWHNFRAKFNGREQKAFEWFCSLLFYKEHGQPLGALRYRNQAGIEADPITVGQDVIGWQAKFLESKISTHKADLIKAIEDAKEENPKLTHVFFYLNIDFDPSSKSGVKDPSYKTEIEAHAKSVGLSITWKTAGFFETPFVCEENAKVAKHFFTQGEKSVIDFTNELSCHTDAILGPIRSELSFTGKSIKIDRSPFTEALKKMMAHSPLVVVSGEGGVGKTAALKDFYTQIKGSAPFFVFKGNEFNVSNVNELFRGFGSFTLADLVQEYQDTEEKFILVDSAEKLSDVEHLEVFQEFLTTVRKSGWKIILTTRLSYLDDLKYAFIQIYNATFEPLNIPNLTSNELVTLSTEYGFGLPQNERLQRLLKIPFYLNEYLQNFSSGETTISYAAFKDAIWNKQIAKSAYRKNNTHRKREECFLEIARERANSGQFFVTVRGFDDEILQLLEADEIIKFDSTARGYFITHDIYEEWALDKIIEQAFREVTDYEAFYRKIGSSLAIRRAFRSWLSEQLSSNDSDALNLIEGTITCEILPTYWKDECIVAVLLSDHAITFINHFEQKLLQLPEKVVGQDPSAPVERFSFSPYKYENSFLPRILFLLRIACKEVDQNFLKLLGIPEFNTVSLSMLVIKPKGKGWESVIRFITKHKEFFGLTYLQFILPVLDDWNQNYKQGETTKEAGQIALFYYNQLTKQDGFYFSSPNDTTDKLVKIIMNGSHEIKTELTNIFDQVVTNKDISHRGRYYELVKPALSALMESAEIVKNLPRKVMKLANLFWLDSPKETGWCPDYSRRIEEHFGLKEGHLEYYPASAFQTPTFPLLQTVPKEAIDFILSFTNKSVECFAKSEFARNEVEEVEVFLNDTETPIKQYICHRIWNIYRGTQVAPKLLESIHMALERWLLMHAKSATPEVLESWCLYLIKNSRSASITAVVASVVLAEPFKLYNVAQVLFRTKEFFFFDMSRMQLDMSAKSTYSISPKGIFRDERLKTCEDKHRSHSLENQALSYQLFASKDEDGEVARNRQEALWKIFDDYYALLPDKSEETEGDKSWRLCLARMDRRNMNITSEAKDDQIILSFNPDIDPELRKHSEDALTTISEANKYMPLKFWTHYKFKRNESEYQKFDQYENNHKLVISDTKEIITGLQNNGREDPTFSLFYHSVPSYTCAVLIRDYFNQLNDQEKDFCKNTILGYAFLPFQSGYNYQIDDGVDAAINVLPLLLKPFPQDCQVIKEILLFTLLDSYPIGMNMHLWDYSVSAILEHLWKVSFEDANSIIFGYLLLKPRFDRLSDLITKENRRKGEYNWSIPAVLQRLKAECQSVISKIISNQLTHKDIPSTHTLDPGSLATAFLVLPLGTTNQDHIKFVYDIGPVLAEAIWNNDREERLNYTLSRRFLDKLPFFILSSRKENIETYLKPYIEILGEDRETENFFSSFIMAEDNLNRYEEFWTVWNLCYSKIVDLCKDAHSRFYSMNVIPTYLLAFQYWRKDAKEWHSLKQREKAFFKKIAEDIGGHPAVLYSLSKFLNEIGSGFADDGIFWISDVLQKNLGLINKGLEGDTVYYLENLVRGYILRNRYKVRTTPKIKNQILVVLNFLLEKGSVSAYMLREDVL